MNVPELPEVETVRRGLAPVMEGFTIVDAQARRPDLRWPFPENFAARLKGQKILGLGRRAKYLLADLSSGEVLVMHLGMSGSFRIGQDDASTAPGKFHHPRSELQKHDHVVFHMSSGAVVTFNDPRRFGFMKLVPRPNLSEDPLIRGLGPEPLGNEFDAGLLARACQGKSASLKAALSDQRVVAGLGNIYVCEALHRAKLSPRKRASILTERSGAPKPAAKELVEVIKSVLKDAIEAGGSSLRDHRRTDGGLGMFQHNFRVYDREGEKCPRRDGGVIKRIVQTGRSTFYCPVCQR
jgi:formamidopyrimidine-DNA glycosylase